MSLRGRGSQPRLRDKPAHLEAESEVQRSGPGVGGPGAAAAAADGVLVPQRAAHMETLGMLLVRARRRAQELNLVGNDIGDRLSRWWEGWAGGQ